MRWLLAAVSIVALASALAPVQAADALQVEDAWVREGPPTATVLAAFMVLRNAGEGPVDVASVSSPQFARVEMHLSRTEDGMAKMIRQERLTVPGGGSLELAPGGYHLMLFDPARPVRAGDRVTFTLRTSDGQEVAIEAEVRRAAGMDGMHHRH